MSGEPPCPVCGQPLYAWIALPPRTAEASVGLPLAGDPASERVIGRCENCGTALEQGTEVDLAAEWAAIRETGAEQVRVPNRASLQAAIGVEGWAAFPLAPGKLQLTPRSLELLAEANGAKLVKRGTPPTLRAQGWMWQTLLNGLTFHPNFFREVRAGRLNAGNGRGRLAFAADMVVTVLGAPLVALVSVPLELIGVIFGRGGEITATVEAG